MKSLLSFFFILHSSLWAKPNVVLFLADDMGWMDSGVYGSEYYETPNIDKFAKRAMRFTNAYSQPLCSPTRGSILSGQYTARHGITTASGHQPPQPAGHVFVAEIDSFPNTAADTNMMHSSAFEVKAGDWQELKIELSDKGALGTLRVCVPDGEIGFIQVTSANGKAQRYDF